MNKTFAWVILIICCILFIGAIITIFGTIIDQPPDVFTQLFRETLFLFIIGWIINKLRDKIKNQEIQVNQNESPNKSKIKSFFSFLNKKKFTVALVAILIVLLFWFLFSLFNDFVERGEAIYKCNRLTGNCVCKVGCPVRGFGPFGQPSLP